MNESNRETLMQLFDAGRVNGVAYLLAVIALGGVTVPELCEITDEHDQTVRKYLRRLATRGFVTVIRDGRGDRYMPAPRAVGLFEPRLLTKFSYAPSSSSDQIRDQIDQSDQIRSEEEGDTRKKRVLVGRFGLTGTKAAEMVSDAWITPIRLVAWFQQVAQMARDGFRFRKSKEAYAMTCLLRHDEPPREAYQSAQRVLDEHLRYMDVEDDVDQSDDGDSSESVDAESEHDQSICVTADVQDAQPDTASTFPGFDPIAHDAVLVSETVWGRTWQAALGELQLQMTKATFDTWVKPALPMWVYDREDGAHVLVIAVPDAHAQDWLQARLLSTVRRILIGIRGCSVDVQFIVGK